MKKLVAALAIMLSSQAISGETPSPEGATVYFINISDGDSVEAPFVVNFGLSGMGVAPAGTEKENTGHHHVFINRPPLGEGAEDAELMENGVPTDDNHRHFGGGQTEVTLDLPSGTHTLQLVLGDEFHVPHNPPVVSEVITITVN
ncbi:MAG: DUF4399 domain-containing protein [Shimia sp.]|nr:DUF4399 domain-containing protein [Shimia sp.]